MNISEDRIAEVLSDIKITNEDHKNKLLRKIELMPVELTYEELANVAGGGVSLPEFELLKDQINTQDPTQSTDGF